MNKDEQIQQLQQELLYKEKELVQFKEEVGRLNARLEKLIDRLERDLTISNQIHELLVPTHIPNIQGFEFSTKFNSSKISGGDYYEVMTNEDRLQFGVLLSSCSGYAMSSLFLNVLLKYSMQLTSRQSFAPEEFVQKTLMDLKNKLSNEDHLSLFYSRIDRRRLEFNYCGFGRLSGYHYIHSEQKLDALEMDPLLFNNDTKVSSPIAKNIKLQPKDRVLLLSEGLCHIQNQNGENIDLNQLHLRIEENILKPIHQLRNEVLLYCQNFSQIDQLSKDQTIIIFDVDERLISLA